MPKIHGWEPGGAGTQHPGILAFGNLPGLLWERWADSACPSCLTCLGTATLAQREDRAVLGEPPESRGLGEPLPGLSCHRVVSQGPGRGDLVLQVATWQAHPLGHTWRSPCAQGKLEGLLLPLVRGEGSAGMCVASWPRWEARAQLPFHAVLGEPQGSHPSKEVMRLGLYHPSRVQISLSWVLSSLFFSEPGAEWFPVAVM